MKRVFLIVLDSFGIGALDDAGLYGDEGSNTLQSISKSKYFNIPNLTKAGLLNIDGVDLGSKEKSPSFAHLRLKEASKGKDTITGHWEICSIELKEPFSTYKNGFPKEFINEFEQKIGSKVICNKPYSGTKVIMDYGKEHLKTKCPIVYTSADSVFQIACHEDVMPLERLYEICKIARDMLNECDRVARVIARPFKGEYPNFERTPYRHDFAIKPINKTILDEISAAGKQVISIGKISDIFANKGITKSIKTVSNDDGMNKLLDVIKSDFNGLCFANLVDFDMLYGHRNDVDGYAKAISKFDFWLGNFIKKLSKDDALIITADHGCDPATISTDHSREYIPCLVYFDGVKPLNLNTRETFSDIGKTVIDLLGIKSNIRGTSFLGEIL